jgi:hypothetical protein
VANSASEGSAVTVSFTDATDPSSYDVTVGLRYSLARTESGLASTYENASPSPSATFTFSEEGPQIVYGRIFDAEGACHEYTIDLSVADAVPQVQVSPVTGNEGQSVQVNATFSDAGQQDTHTARIDWGDGNVTDGTVVESSGLGSVQGSHIYADDGAYTIRVLVSDDEGVIGSGQAQATIANLAPTAIISPDQAVVEDTTVTVSLGSAQDGPADAAAGLHYSFATSTDALASSYATASGSSQATLSFSEAGVYTVYARIIDQDGASNTYSTDHCHRSRARTEPVARECRGRQRSELHGQLQRCRLKGHPDGHHRWGRWLGSDFRSDQ